MEKTAFRLIKALSSETRLKVMDSLSNGMEHPDEIAAELGITRQSVDKHLLLLHQLGIVERSAVFPPDGRPRIVYRLSSAGKELLNDVDELGKRHRARLRSMYASEKRVLDMGLAEGELSEEIYLRKLSALKERYGLE